MSIDIDKMKSLVKEASEMKKEFDEATLKVGVIGPSGSGKSSTMNAIAGEKISQVGSTEQTMEAQSFFHLGIEFVDLPGCGTEKWPQSSYISDLNLESYDCLIIITSNRLYESDIYLHNEMAVQRNKPCYVVRNKIDLAILDEAHDNNLSEEETLIKVRENICSRINSSNGDVYLTSARHPAKWDFSRLLDDIANSQVGVKKDKFVEGMAIWSEKALIKKRKVARDIVSWSSVASAANALNPIPGVDVGVDVTVLINMVKQVNRVYGLTKEQIKFAEEGNLEILESPEYVGLKQGILKIVAKYTTVEGILLVLKRMGTKVLIKNISKYLPFLGQLISAGIGYKMTASFGDSYIHEVEVKAKSLLDNVIKQS